MGERDIVTKDYMADPEVFADAFNYFLYGGRQVIRPEQLHKKDTAALAIPYGKGNPVKDSAKAKKDSMKAVQRYRDNLKSLTMMEDDDTAYLILGIEGQTEQHLAMPVRNMLYDALQYAEQVSETARVHRRERKRRGSAAPDPKPDKAASNEEPLSSSEFLSGFYREDRLIPVITLVILFNTEAWSGPVSLHEMFAARDKEIMQYIPDYPINLMAPAAMEDEEINLLSSSLREVIIFLKYAEDKDRMAELMSRDDRFRNLDRKAANVINTLMNCGLEIDEETEEGVDMCIAWDNMRKDARMEGERLGLEKGERLGLEKGERLGLEKGLSNLMTSMGWSVQQAMDALQIPKEEQAHYAEALKS